MTLALRAPEFGAIAAFVYWTKSYYSGATAEDLRWLLGAVAQVTTVLSGTVFTWEPGAGYISQAHLLVIAPACAGLNFFISAWLTLLVTTSGATRPCWRWLQALACLIPALVGTVLINAHRVHLLLSGYADHRAVGVSCFCIGLLGLACVSYGIAQRKLPSVGVLTGCVALYLFIALGLPALNGAGAEPLFFEHAVFVLERGLLILAVSAGLLSLIRLALRGNSVALGKLLPGSGPAGN